MSARARRASGCSRADEDSEGSLLPSPGALGPRGSMTRDLVEAADEPVAGAATAIPPLPPPAAAAAAESPGTVSPALPGTRRRLSAGLPTSARAVLGQSPGAATLLSATLTATPRDTNRFLVPASRSSTAGMRSPEGLPASARLRATFGGGTPAARFAAGGGAAGTAGGGCGGYGFGAGFGSPGFGAGFPSAGSGGGGFGGAQFNSSPSASAGVRFAAAASTGAGFPRLSLPPAAVASAPNSRSAWLRASLSEAGESAPALRSLGASFEFWLRGAEGEAGERAEALEQAGALLAQLEASAAGAASRERAAAAETERLRAELRALQTERDALMGRKCVLEARLDDRAAGAAEELHARNAELRREVERLTAELAAYGTALATAKVQCATFMEDRERLGKLCRYYAAHVPPDLVISMNDREKIEGLVLGGRGAGLAGDLAGGPAGGAADGLAGGLIVRPPRHSPSSRPSGSRALERLREWALGNDHAVARRQSSLLRTVPPPAKTRPAPADGGGANGGLGAPAIRSQHSGSSLRSVVSRSFQGVARNSFKYKLRSGSSLGGGSRRGERQATKPATPPAAAAAAAPGPGFVDEGLATAQQSAAAETAPSAPASQAPKGPFLAAAAAAGERAADDAAGGGGERRQRSHASGAADGATPAGTPVKDGGKGGVAKAGRGATGAAKSAAKKPGNAAAAGGSGGASSPPKNAGPPRRPTVPTLSLEKTRKLTSRESMPAMGFSSVLVGPSGPGAAAGSAAGAAGGAGRGSPSTGTHAAKKSWMFGRWGRKPSGEGSPEARGGRNSRPGVAAGSAGPPAAGVGPRTGLRVQKAVLQTLSENGTSGGGGDGARASGTAASAGAAAAGALCGSESGSTREGPPSFVAREVAHGAS